MTIYIITFLILMIFSLSEICFHIKKEVRYIELIISFAILLLLLGLREETGTDWLVYKENYENILSGGIPNQGFEFGYNLIVKLFSQLGASYSEFLFFYTFIYMLLFYNFLRNYKNCSTIVLLLYSAYLLGQMGAARQILAIAICVNAFYLLVKNQKYRFIILVLIASTIHYSAIVFLLMIFLDRKINLRSKYFILFIVAYLLFFILINIGFEDFLKHIPADSRLYEQFSAYSTKGDNLPIYKKDIFTATLIYAKRFLLLLMFIILSDKENRNDNLAFNSYLASFIIFLLFYNILPAVAVRLSLYFSIFDIILISQLVKSKKFILFNLSLIIAFSIERLNRSFYEDYEMFIPYKGLYINNNVIRPSL